MVLGHFIKESIENEDLTDNPIGVFYPFLFPEFEYTTKKPSKEIWLSIPGAVDPNKRDYTSLLKLNLPKHIKLILLGNSTNPISKKIVNQLKQSSIAENLVLFEGFIPFNVFHSYLKQSDFVLPLIHPSNEQFSNFLNYKITGSFNLAIAYKIPLLLEESFRVLKEFNDCAVYYNSELFTFKTMELKSNETFYNSDKWNFEHQKESYQKFIFS